MKRALCLLVLSSSLLAACSHSSPKAGRSPAPTESPTPAATSDPTPTVAPTTAAPTAKPFAGPVGTTVPKGFRPQSASFISDSTGYVLGAAPCPSGTGRCDVIARTTDGAASWKAIPAPRTSPDTLAQIRWADERTGFVTGDVLWVTHDGGATWEKGSASQGPVQVAAGRVWRASDRGLESAPVTSLAFTVEVGGPVKVENFSLRGDEAIFGVAGQGSVRTVRHGQKVVDHRSPCASDEQAVPAEGSGTHWFVVCEGEAGLGHQAKKAFQSFDAGASWKAAGEPPAASGTNVYITTDGTFVLDHQQVAVFRGSGWSTVLRTDGGVFEGGFESARLGFCIGGFGGTTDQTMKLTHDAGRTWTTVAF